MKRPHANTLIGFDEARQVVRRVAELDDTFFLVSVIPDPVDFFRPICYGDSAKMTIAVPSRGVLLGSLVSELALLHVRGGLGAARDEAAYQRRKDHIRLLVLAAARELPARSSAPQ
jgi:hypothetical protein